MGQHTGMGTFCCLLGSDLGKYLIFIDLYFYIWLFSTLKSYFCHENEHYKKYRLPS